jgi:Ca-activated chloride channel family protein
MAARASHRNNMSSWTIGLCLLACGLVISSPTAQQTPPESSSPQPRANYKTGVDLVSLNVIVLDPQERLIGNLNRSEFAVYEDGVRQELSYFETSDIPLDLALLIDTSASMDNKLAFVRKAAAGFARTLRPGDRGAVITFNGRVNVQQAFTKDVNQITQAISQTSPSGGTALYNAVYVTLKEFAREAKADDKVRRQAMVVLSDGEDTASLLSFDELLEEARRAGVTTYTIGLKEDSLVYTTARANRYFSQADFCLKSLARETGATSYFPDREQDLVGAYRAIGEELAQQYALGYVSKNQIKNGAYRRVVVRIVDRPDARPRTRSGYTATVERPAPSGSQQD